MHNDNTDGIAFLCDVDGHILKVLHDSFGLPALQPGGNLLALFGPFSEAKAANLLSAVRNQEIVLDWELNLPLSGTVVTLRLAGGRKDDKHLPSPRLVSWTTAVLGRTDSDCVRS